MGRIKGKGGGRHNKTTHETTISSGVGERRPYAGNLHQRGKVYKNIENMGKITNNMKSNDGYEV